MRKLISVALDVPINKLFDYYCDNKNAQTGSRVKVPFGSSTRIGLIVEINKLEIKKDALKEIANLAIEQKTGARGLRSIIEKLLIDLMFEAPDKKDLETVVINKDTVLQKSEPILLYSNKQHNNQKILANKS